MKSNVKDIIGLLPLIGLFYIVKVMIENLFYGIAILIVLISLLYLIFPLFILDRRFKTGYKNNVLPMSFFKRLAVSLIGLLVSFFVFLIGNVEYPKGRNIATVTAKKGLNLRSDTLIKSSNIILTVQYKDTVEIITQSTGSWVKVLYKGDRGWMSGKYLDIR